MEPTLKSVILHSSSVIGEYNYDIAPKSTRKEFLNSLIMSLENQRTDINKELTSICNSQNGLKGCESEKDGVAEAEDDDLLSDDEAEPLEKVAKT
ncbi:hypothetical protein QYM36_017819 [Artemia franciscana]|uniref:Uncharacterized protein n=1 Tax=Artemia franciscana TaxID=6661 RepID=A0AA88H5U9_ARTSF|nr:hypothetical protein QYM36_017819 [Artemia franciscana]KAK2703895.1 hypothetical protein QYM36_017819 [Artemia franciscana]